MIITFGEQINKVNGTRKSKKIRKKHDNLIKPTAYKDGKKGFKSDKHDFTASVALFIHPHLPFVFFFLCFSVTMVICLMPEQETSARAVAAVAACGDVASCSLASPPVNQLTTT